MSSSLDVRRGIQTPQILHLPPDVVSLGAATEAIELAESCDLWLDESQCITLQAAMGERADHKWAAFEVADVEPRQSGKNDTVMVAEAHGLFIAGDHLQLHTAHEAATANESFLRMEQFISNNSELRAQVARFRYGNGDHAVELKSGGRLLYKTRTGGAARGFAGASRLVYDEALFLQARQVAASLATLARGKTRAHNPQVWSLSSAGLSTSTFLWSIRKRALAGDAGRLAYVEHTAEEVSIADDGRLVSNRGRIDLDDRRLWAIANPAMNHPDHGISEEFIENERRAQSDDPDGWARERLGVFDPMFNDSLLRDVKLPEDLWVATVGPDLPKSVPMVALTFDVTKDGEWSSIAWSAGTLQSPYVEVKAHRPGAGWLATELVALVNKHHPVVVACNGAGPAGAQVGPVLAAFRQAGIRTELVQLSAREYVQACGGFYTDVIEGRLRRPAGQRPLDLAAGDAGERVLGEAWVWDLRSATVPISPLVAVTIARALLPAGSMVSVYDEERGMRVI
jgi:hypothetical protein